ncbi:hypothetical protein PENTCL1PPCAC_25427 [Pristionchus entomophagus]|uniref:Leucine carboxyl methyltransferase 1 n=1 Tax=Pristionchus entomophagus TaxID=358040 RepID=A0AAV5U9Y0_9BILA|nr:hypothetical protein PENTCL1PPCAC_25427 [Pristionchus entomophagus]
METEAVLSESVKARRRSSSVNDDYSVQKTNDDASQSKLAAVKLGYWKDEFLVRFVSMSSDDGRAVHRDPEISLGYWARITIIRHYVDRFLAQAGDRAQIISIGSGFDTLFWRIKSEGAKFARFVEVDFSSVTAKKLRVIRRPSNSSALAGLFREDAQESQHTDLHAGDYHLVGADVRQWAELRAKLEEAGVDWNAPTLVIAECVLIYMAVSQSEELLAHLTKEFGNVAILSYEQTNIHDEFGRVMTANLEKRGLTLAGIAACGSIESQKKRLVEAGFTNGTIDDMNSVFNKKLTAEERNKVLRIECLDEMELLRQLNEHYSISFATRAPEFDNFGEPTL